MKALCPIPPPPYVLGVKAWISEPGRSEALGLLTQVPAARLWAFCFTSWTLTPPRTELRPTAAIPKGCRSLR